MWSFLSGLGGTGGKQGVPTSPPPVNHVDDSGSDEGSTKATHHHHEGASAGGFRVSLPKHDGGSATCLVGATTTAKHRRQGSNGGLESTTGAAATSASSTSAPTSSASTSTPTHAVASLPPLPPTASTSSSAPPSCSIPDSGSSTPQRGTTQQHSSGNSCSMRPSASPSTVVSLLLGGGGGSGAATATTTPSRNSNGGKGSSSPPLLPVAKVPLTSLPVVTADSGGKRRRLSLFAKTLLALVAVVALAGGLSRRGSSASKGGADAALASLRAIYNLRGAPGSWGSVLSGAWRSSSSKGNGDVAAATASATSSPSLASAAATTRPSKDLLIPRIIHQTYRSEAELPPAATRLMASWRELNPTWEVRFWDDADCLSFVEAEFPEWAPAYRALPKDVERSDFFRYLVVLRYGGLYADVDTECRVSLDDVLLPTDTLVVGWENEFATAPRAASRKYVRKRQVLQWAFAGAPGHPALRAACEHVARNAWSSMSRAGNTDTLERTGPGAFTDAVLDAAERHAPAGARSDPWGVRVLPKVALGAHPRGLDGVDPRDPRVAVLHHYLGTWKSVGGWAPGGGLLGAAVAALLPGALAPKGTASKVSPSPPGAKKGKGAEVATAAAEEDGDVEGDGGRPKPMEAALPFDSAVPRLYPVSLLGTSSPPVTALVPLVGSSEKVSGEDVAAALTTYGAWQPGGPPRRRLVRRWLASGGSGSSPSSSSPSLAPSPFGDEPTPIEALLGGLDAATLASKRAAEAEERRETEEGDKGSDGGGDASPSSTPPDSTPTGEDKGDAAPSKRRDHRAVLLDLGAGLGAASLAAASRGHRAIAAEAGPRLAAALRASAAYNGFEDLIEVHEVAVGAGGGKVGDDDDGGGPSPSTAIPTLACLDEKVAPSRSAFTDAARGYGARPPPKVVAAASSDPSPSPSTPASCLRTARRVHASSLVPALEGGVSGGSRSRVGAVRVSAPGWEDVALDGLLRRLSSSHLPAVLLVELDVAALNAAAAAAAAATPPAARARKLGPADDDEGGDASRAEGARASRGGGGDFDEDYDSLYFVADDDRGNSTSPPPPPPSSPSARPFPSLANSDAPTLLRKLRSLGYLHVSHSGAACGARWGALARSLGLPPPGSAAAAAAAAAERDEATLSNGTSSLAPLSSSSRQQRHLPSGVAAAAGEGADARSTSRSSGRKKALPEGALAPPVWCRLPSSEVPAFERASLAARTPETVLLIHASAVADAAAEEEEEGGGD